MSRGVTYLALGALLVTGCPIDERRLSGAPSVSAGAPDGSDSGEAGERQVAPSSTGGRSPASGGSGTGDSGQAGEPGTAGGEAGESGSGGAGGAGPIAGSSNAGGAGGMGTAGRGAGMGGTLAGQGGRAGGSAMGGTVSGMGGAGRAGAAGSGGGGRGGAGSGGAGAGGAPGPLCGDLEEDGIDDCRQTIVANAAFVNNTLDWFAERNVTTLWDSANAAADTRSGALAITFAATASGTGMSMAAAQQCLPRVDLGYHWVGARFFVPGGQGEGWAALNILLFSEERCAGALVASKTLPIQVETDEWVPVVEKIHVPPSARSIVLRLAAIKPNQQPSLTIRFDSILVRHE